MGTADFKGIYETLCLISLNRLVFIHDVNECDVPFVADRAGLNRRLTHHGKWLFVSAALSHVTYSGNSVQSML